MKKRLMVGFVAAAMCVSVIAGTTACGRTDSAASGQSSAAQTAPIQAAPEPETAVSAGTQTVTSAEATGKADAPSANGSQDEPIVGADPSTWSPFTDCESLSEAENVAGFKISIPESIDGYKDISYAAMKEYRLIQVDFKADENHYITIRKAVDDKDISGDYNVYDETSETTIDGNEVTLKGNGGNICLATWTSGDYAYSIMCADLSGDSESSSYGLSASQMAALISAVR